MCIKRKEQKGQEKYEFKEKCVGRDNEERGNDRVGYSKGKKNAHERTVLERDKHRKK